VGEDGRDGEGGDGEDREDGGEFLLFKLETYAQRSVARNEACCSNLSKLPYLHDLPYLPISSIFPFPHVLSDLEQFVNRVSAGTQSLYLYYFYLIAMPFPSFVEMTLDAY
jgi:hypothetical protein